jgi:hypothetical protein
MRRCPQGEVVIILMVLCLGLFSSASLCSEENDLWLLLSSYEDIGMTVKDLAFFLATHGYNAVPDRTYVTVEFSNGDKAYLTSNGAAPRLADLWLLPPEETTGPVLVISPEAIQKNATFNKTENRKFIKNLRNYVIFPLTPLGMCYDGSEELAGIYTDFGYYIKYMYDPAQWDWQGHLWIIVEDTENPGMWVAVDSYYGIMDDYEYYRAPYSFVDIQYLDYVNPKWRLM